MTQIVLHQSEAGIILAGDSRAVTHSPQGQPHYLKVQKIFQLSPHVVLVTGGAGYGIPLCRAFLDHVTRTGLWVFDDILYRAIPFFRSHIQKVHQENPSFSGEPDLDRIYFILAGYVPQADQDRFRFVVLGSEHAGDTLHAIPTGHFAAIPRNLRIEYRLSRLSPSELPLDGIEALLEELIVKVAEASDDVGPPFHFVRITEDGISVRTAGEGNGTGHRKG